MQRLLQHPLAFNQNWSLFLPGRIKQMLDSIIEQRSRGNSTVALTTKTKLMLKGVNPDLFTAASPDDPAIMARVRAIANELGATVH